MQRLLPAWSGESRHWLRLRHADTRCLLSPSLQDNSSILVEYYFKEVCGMMSCYDSKLNPYRTTIANLWGTSPTLYYVTQSMAAACLSEVSPGLVTASGRLRDQAVRSLWNESRVDQTATSSLLALVMLGFSLCWHDPSSLGQSEFELLAETVTHLDSQSGNLTPIEKQKRFFFHNSLVYWKMLLSLVTDQELPILGATREIQPQPAFVSTQKNVVMPHPQTGIGVDVHELVAQAGALVRKERRRIRRRQHSSRHDIEQSINAIRTAEQVQAKLCALDLPRKAAVMDSGDDMTPTDHLLKTAEAYRCTGLLQLYRNFPDLLFDGTSPVTLASPPSWLETSESASCSHSEDSSVILGTWLTSLALHVIDLVQDIPISSRSRSIQPLLLVSICSELSLGRTLVPAPYMKKSAVASIGSSPRMKVSPTITDVLHARRLIVSRLTSFEGILGCKSNKTNAKACQRDLGLFGQSETRCILDGRYDGQGVRNLDGLRAIRCWDVYHGDDE
ncbi:C6 zinc finger domain-containing protein [Colletotrichum graminicola]|nr:C6 zinc finger domain-containing protein [Colletotrichum graminicola]